MIYLQRSNPSALGWVGIGLGVASLGALAFAGIVLWRMHKM